MRSRLLALSLLAALGAQALAQDTLQTMPRFDRYEKLRREIFGSVKRGEVAPRWDEDGKSFLFDRDGKTYRYDVGTRKATESTGSQSEQPRRQRRANPERGRQFDTAFTADGKLKAFHRDRNVYVSDASGKNEFAVTTDGSTDKRTKYGIASWVYGEELGVKEALFWSPDGKTLAFYKFDEGEVKDYHLALDQSKFQSKLDVEAYPKAGTANPKVDLFLYDLASRQTTRVDTGDPSGTAHYVYEVRWSPKGDELFFNRTNRKQNAMEWCAADRSTGKSRVILREEQPQSWTDNASSVTYLGPNPTLKFLADKERFLWMSERNGFRNLYLYDIRGKLINSVTQHPFEVVNILQVDEKRNLVYYTARSAENPYLVQLHRVGLDGKGDRRLTDPSFNHTISLAPDGRHFVDVAQRIDVAPTTRLMDENGKALDTLAESDLTKFNALGLKRSERFTFTAADGKTQLYGDLHFPSNFDPAKKYPLIVSVYGGPESGGGDERFEVPNPITELGFLVASFEGRGTSGRGKAFKDAVYGKLGVVEIDDQAAGVRALAARPYVNGKRVGIFGTSYGGYASVMAILRHPDVFHVACASSSVTDWRQYDTIYTERYMGLPWDAENKAGYDAGSAMTYVKNLKGKLMLYFGSADNNVHPSNTYQLVQALEGAGKRYDMQVGPDRGHTSMNSTRMWEYFVTHLILNTPRDSLAVVWKPQTK